MKCATDGVVEDFVWCPISEAFSGPMIESFESGGNSLFRQSAQVCPLWKILAQQAIGVLVAAALPGGIGIGEEHPQTGSFLDQLELRKLLAVIDGESFEIRGHNT